MARRRMTIKRIDPWSVLKFGAVLNVVFLAVFLLVMGVVWYIIEQLALVDQVCSIATDVGFTSCGVEAGPLFRAVLVIGGLWSIIATALLVFGAFLHNLIADLTGGIVVATIDDLPLTPAAGRGTGAATGPITAGRSPATVRGRTRPDQAPPDATRPQPRVGRAADDARGDELFTER